MTNEEKVRENRLRRKLERMGYEMKKSARKDRDALDFGCYIIVDAETNGVVAGASSGGWAYFDIDDVEEWIVGEVVNKGKK